MSDLQTLQDIALAAQRSLEPGAWDFLIGGSGSETTVKRNRREFDKLALQATPFNDVSRIDVSTQLFGQRVTAPVFLAPMGSISLFDPAGARAAAQAAHEAGVPAFVSGVADPGIEAVCAEPHGSLVYTLYVQGDRQWLNETLDRLAALPLAAIAVLADAPYYARRDRDLINEFRPKVVRSRLYADVQRAARAAGGVAPEELDPAFHSAKTTWSMLELVKQRTGLPLVVKGVMSARTATRCVEHGADVIYVSNHGGRQLDHQPGTLAVLAEVVDAVGTSVPVLVDGGCLRGGDILKCLAMGARAVGIGRVQALALAAGGAGALVRALRILEEELLVDMGLLGVTCVDELNRTHLLPAEPLGAAHVLGGYPVVMERLQSGGRMRT